MSDTLFEIPDAVANAIEDGSTALKAFRQFFGKSQHDVATDVGMSDERLAQIESGLPPTDTELAVLSQVLGVPVDLLTEI